MGLLPLLVGLTRADIRTGRVWPNRAESEYKAKGQPFIRACPHIRSIFLVMTAGCIDRPRNSLLMKAQVCRTIDRVGREKTTVKSGIGRHADYVSRERLPSFWLLSLSDSFNSQSQS